jgi:hypothetical protein
VINNRGLTRYVAERLSSSTRHFAMSAVTKRGFESERATTVRDKIAWKNSVARDRDFALCP